MGASSGSGLSQAGLHLRWPIRLFQWECYQLGKDELAQNPDVQPHRGEEADSWMNGRLENACLLACQYSTTKNDLFPLVESIQGWCDDGS